MLTGAVLAATLAQISVPDPYRIFQRAQQIWMAQRYPRVVDYTVRVMAIHGGKTEVRHYHEFWAALTNDVLVQPPVSDEQLASPYKPSSGVNFMGLWNIGGPRKGSGVQGDIYGVPALRPNYSFGIAPYTPPASLTPAQLVAEIRREYHDPAPQKVAALEAQHGLKTIALVTSVARDYTISLVGVESLGGHSDFHLSLRPVRDPQRYRLRDAWIDASTYTTDRLGLMGNFKDVAMARVPWIVDFEQLAGATYISKEVSQAPLQGYRSRMYDRFLITFEDYTTGKVPFMNAGARPQSALDEP